MLGKSSVIMMLLIITASLVGISSMYQPANVETQPQTQQQLQQGQTIFRHVIGKVDAVHVYSSPSGEACLADVIVVHPGVDKIRHRPGQVIYLISPGESTCVLLGQSKVGKTQIDFKVEKITTADAIPPIFRFPPEAIEIIYRVHDIRMY